MGFRGACLGNIRLELYTSNPTYFWINVMIHEPTTLEIVNNEPLMTKNHKVDMHLDTYFKSKK